MSDHRDDEWRVTEGPAFGVEPEFELSNIRLGAHFTVSGAILRRITADLVASLPTLVESIGIPLPELSGFLGIYDEHSGRAVLPIKYGLAVELGVHRGVMALVSPDRYVMHLYLPTDQFEMILPMFASPPSAARLRIEVDRTLDQGLLDSQSHFWNDRRSPVILFNEFELSLPARDGSHL